MKDVLLGLICTLMGLSLGLTIGGCCMQRIEQSRAIEAKVGQWIINPKTGDSQFQYGIVK